MDKEIVISIKTVIFTFSLLLGIYLLYLIRPIIVLLVISLIIVISMEHPIEYLGKITFMNKPLSRSVAVLSSYFLLVLFVVVIITIGVPPVITQAQTLISNLANLTTEFPGTSGLQFSVKDLLPDVANVSKNVFSTTFSVLSSVAGLFSVLIISIYMSLDWENIKFRLFSLFKGKIRGEIEDTVTEIEVSLGHWVKGQLALMGIIGAMSFVGLVILQVDYPLALSLIAGLLEIVPVLGPVIALLLAGIVGFSDSVAKGIAVAGLFTLIQQVENNFLVPKVMHKVSGFSPLVILIALLVGSTLLGVVGALIAIPVTMILVIIFKHISRYSE